MSNLKGKLGNKILRKYLGVNADLSQLNEHGFWSLHERLEYSLFALLMYSSFHSILKIWIPHKNVCHVLNRKKNITPYRKVFIKWNFGWHSKVPIATKLCFWSLLIMRSQGSTQQFRFFSSCFFFSGPWLLDLRGEKVSKCINNNTQSLLKISTFLIFFSR